MSNTANPFGVRFAGAPRTLAVRHEMIRDIGPELSLCWPVLPMRLREDAQAEFNFFGGPP